MRRDAVVGVVGALILVVALVGVFRYESASSPSPSYHEGAPVALAPFEGSAAPGMDYNFPVPISPANLSRVEFKLESASGATLHLKVVSPDGQSREQQGSGAVNVTFVVAPPPTEGAALNATAGAGNWTVTVRVDAPSGPLPVTPPTALPGGSSGVAYKLSPTTRSYVAG